MLSTILLAVLVGDIAAVIPSSAQLQSPPVRAQQAAENPWPPPGVYRRGNDVTLPRLIGDQPKPSYTADAMRAKVQGLIGLEAVVLPDGNVGETRVTRSLDRRFGLDDEAVATLKKWRFVAGTKDGVAVPVLFEVEMSFTLGQKGRR